MNEKTSKQLIDLYNTLFTIQSQGEDTLKIASCLMVLRQMLNQIETGNQNTNDEN